MKSRYLLKLAILSAFLFCIVARPAESLSVLLQKGIFAEETEGNLDAAIRIYEGITKVTEANRSLVAQAGDLVRFAVDDEQKRRVYQLFSYTNSELHEILTARIPEGFDWIWELWRGPTIILGKPIDQDKQSLTELWTFAVRSGELEKMDLSLPKHERLVIHEGGKRLLFRTVEAGSREVWVMENFLPPVARK